MSSRVISAVFLGGALGSAVRYLIFLGVEAASLSEPETALLATSIVNLIGALFLGLVQAGNSNKTLLWHSFWGTGVAGGFTTMSGLTLVTYGANLGPFGNGTIFWSAVALQLIVGVLAYWLGRKIGGSSAWQNLIGGKP